MKDKVVIIGASITGTYTMIELVKNKYAGDITIIEQWGMISAIYVSECCISDGNRRKLMKKKKTDDLTIRFLNESRIEEVIYGGKYDGFHKN